MAEPDAELKGTKAAAAKSPRDFDTWIKLGQANNSARNFTQAAEAFEKAVTLRPDDFTAEAALAVALTNAGSYADGEAHAFRAVELAPKDARSHASLAFALYGSGKHEEALAAADRALALGAGDQLAQLVRLGVLLSLRRFDDAADAGLAALKQWPNEPAVIRAAAVTAFRAHRFSSAVELATALLRHVPNDPEAHLIVGIGLSGLHRIREAEDAYRVGLDAAPNDSELLNSLGFLLVVAGRPQEGEPYIRASLRNKETWYANGSLAAALLSLADAFKDEDLYEEAISTVDRAILLIAADQPDPNEDARLYLQRGYAYARTRRFGSAREDFRVALQKASSQSAVALAAGRNLRRLNLAILRTPDPPVWLPHAVAGTAAGLLAIAVLGLFIGAFSPEIFTALVFGALVATFAAYSLPTLTKLRLGVMEFERQVGTVPDISLEIIHIG